MVALRRSTPALVYGDYKDLDPQNPTIFAYTRTLGPDKYLVVLNFSEQRTAYSLPAGMKAGQLVISNLPASESHTSQLSLKGWEARVYKL
jgi:oligo-1,6-glucosidase